MDLFPEMGLDFGRGVKPCIGAGFTIGFDNSRTATKDIPMYDAHGQYVRTCTDKTLCRDFIYGFVAQPSLEFQTDEFSARGAIKYRFFFDDQHYEWTLGTLKDSSGNTDYRRQSLDFILSAGVNLGTCMLEAGLQAENWALKHEDDKEWPKWPEDWEYMLFGKLHFGY